MLFFGTSQKVLLRNPRVTIGQQHEKEKWGSQTMTHTSFYLKLYILYINNNKNGSS